MTDRTGWDERNKPEKTETADPAGIMTPALREALDALELEFQKMIKERNG